MKKILLSLFLIITLTNCEDKMAGTKVNAYTPTDPNPENWQETTDTQRRGYMALSLSNFDTTSAPQIEAGSCVEIAGSLFEFDTIDSISTTDPYTSSTVADGTVYIVLQASGSSVSASWTATAPAWDATKQGYYKATTSDRYIGGCALSGTTSIFSGKYLFAGKEKSSGAKTRIKAHNTSAVVASANPLIYDTKSFDTKNEYSTSTGLITIKNDGFYKYYAHIYTATVTAGRYMDAGITLYVGSTMVSYAKHTCDYADTNGQLILTIDTDVLLELSAGDVLKVQLVSNASYVETWGGSEWRVYFTLEEI